MKSYKGSKKTNESEANEMLFCTVSAFGCVIIVGMLLASVLI